MKCLYVLFDADCELCVRCRNWLARQPAFVPLVFIAFQSEEAERRFAALDALKPREQLLVISDEGAVYRGAHAWIMCLWALEKYREHSQRLANPALLPFAKAVCELLSRNRFFLSDVLFRHGPRTTRRGNVPAQQSEWRRPVVVAASLCRGVHDVSDHGDRAPWLQRNSSCANGGCRG